MELEILLQVIFNRPVTPEANLAVEELELTLNGKPVGFDIGKQIFYIDIADHFCVLFKLSSLHCNMQITIEDLKSISSIGACNVSDGKSGRSNLAVKAIIGILFAVSKPSRCAIPVKDKIVRRYNSQSNCELVDASFTSVWDSTTVTIPCKVNIKTREVFDIDLSSEKLEGRCLQEFITLGGEQFPVRGKAHHTNEGNEYWYSIECPWFVQFDSQGRPVSQPLYSKYII